MLSPSVETKTSVLRWVVPENPTAASSMAAVEAMLVVAPAPSAVSRPAISATWRSDCPGRIRITFRSSTSSPAKVASNRCSATVAPSTEANRALTSSASASSASDPGRGADAELASSLVSSTAASPSNASGGRPGSSGCGTSSRENMASSVARGTTNREILHRRRSITRSRPSNLQSMAREQARILLVDDEQAVQTLLTYPLRKEGYDVVGAMDGQEALDRFTEQRFDLVVLDIMLPKLDGIEVCRRLRTRSQVPIIMLTAKGDEIDKIAGLEMGADDYITKPFSVREFRSRVKAALRRGNMSGLAGAEPIKVGGLEVDFERRATTIAGEPIQLTYVEFEILAALASSPGRVFTREMLLENVWGDSTYRDPRTVDVHIRHLREKLESDPKNPEYLFTVRGVGYRFRDSERD
jgi:DNA-binding response OmpR family regulator